MSASPPVNSEPDSRQREDIERERQDHLSEAERRAMSRKTLLA